jgi:hypothetical protein
MKFFIALLAITFFSCNQSENKKEERLNSLPKDSTQILQSENGIAVNMIDSYQVTDTLNDFILFPLKINNAKPEEETASSYSKQRNEGDLFWNVVFLNYKTNETTLLEPNKKILIGGYNVEYYSSNWGSTPKPTGIIESAKQTNYIFYTVYTDDFNNDKKLGTDDPAYFFISNEDGSNFKQVSPLNVSILQKTFPKNNSFLLLEGLKDSNNDKIFNAKDEKVYYKINMADSLFKSQEIFSPMYKLSLKKLFDKNWKN